MNIVVSPTLSGLQTALTAPEPERLQVFKTEVMDPIRPCWEVSVQRMGMASTEGDLALTVAQRFMFFTPELGAERGLDALKTLEEAGSLQENAQALQKALDLLQPAQHGIEIKEMHLAMVLGDPDRMAPEQYTGVGNVPGWIMVMLWPNPYNLPRLAPITVHEFHHQVRFQYEPFFPLTLGKYLVAEGLAEAFATELYGEDRLGPWATTLTLQDLEALKPRFRDALHESDFGVVRGYIFGDWAAEGWGSSKLGIPSFAGYAMGFRMVQAYLQRTGKSIVEATYTPWDEIVRESGFLD